VKITCPVPAMIATLPTSRILSKLSSSPTRNSSSAIPFSEIISSFGLISTHPSSGPISTPASR
jgi:hypothetical protein